MGRQPGGMGIDVVSSCAGCLGCCGMLVLVFVFVTAASDAFGGEGLRSAATAVAPSPPPVPIVTAGLRGTVDVVMGSVDASPSPSTLPGPPSPASQTPVAQSDLLEDRVRVLEEKGDRWQWIQLLTASGMALVAAAVGAVLGGLFSYVVAERSSRGAALMARIGEGQRDLAALRSAQLELERNLLLARYGGLQVGGAWVTLHRWALDNLAPTTLGSSQVLVNAHRVVDQYNALAVLSNSLATSGEPPTGGVSREEINAQLRELVLQLRHVLPMTITAMDRRVSAVERHLAALRTGGKPAGAGRWQRLLTPTVSVGATLGEVLGQERAEAEERKRAALRLREARLRERARRRDEQAAV